MTEFWRKESGSMNSQYSSAPVDLPEFVDFVCSGFLASCKRGWFGDGGDPGDLALTVLCTEISTCGRIRAPESRVFS